MWPPERPKHTQEHNFIMAWCGEIAVHRGDDSVKSACTAWALLSTGWAYSPGSPAQVKHAYEHAKDMSGAFLTCAFYFQNGAMLVYKPNEREIVKAAWDSYKV